VVHCFGPDPVNDRSLAWRTEAAVQVMENDPHRQSLGYTLQRPHSGVKIHPAGGAPNRAVKIPTGAYPSKVDDTHPPADRLQRFDSQGQPL